MNFFFLLRHLQNTVIFNYIRLARGHDPINARISYFNKAAPYWYPLGRNKNIYETNLEKTKKRAPGPFFGFLLAQTQFCDQLFVSFWGVGFPEVIQ